MSINSYKLVPVKMFEDLIKNKQPPVENERSVKSIIEQSQNNTSNDPSSQKYSTSIGPQMSVGQGNELSTPMWVYDNQSILPDYSQGKKVSDSLDAYRNMLDNDSIPEHLKIQLLQYLRDRYDRSRVPHTEQVEEEGDPNVILHSILGPMSAHKRTKALNIVKVFLNNSNLINWNSMGEFILPRYASINLRSLIRTLVYANVGSDQDILGVIEIIKPFYKHIRPYIVNRRVIAHLDNIRDSVSKKYVALKPMRKKRKVSE